MDPFVLNGETIPRTDLIARLQAVVADMRQTRADRLAAAASLARERASLASTAPLLAALKTFVQARYGKTSPRLQHFGFVQNRKPKVRADAKAAGAAKARATRTALGTKGRQQKAVARASGGGAS
jgi:hypothetical protein